MSPTELRTTPPASAERYYHPELDGLRFFAFLAVFVLHMFPVVYPQHPPSSPLVREALAWIVSIASAGEAGVDLFFVLSSFLISELLLREFDALGTIDVKAFYARRGLRIWPLYFFFLLIAPAIDLWLGKNFGVGVWEWLSFATFTNNWLVSLKSLRLNTVMVLLWTVAIEEQFYLGWPLLVKWLQPKRLALLAVSLIVTAWVTRLYLGMQEASDLTITRNTLARLDAIGIGALLCVGYRKLGWNFSAPVRRWLGILGLALIVGSYRYLKIGMETSLATPVMLGLWAIGGGLLLVSVYRPQVAGEKASGICSWPWLVDLGKISYGLYVWHLAAIAIVSRLGLAKPGTLLSAIYALVLTIVLAKVSYAWLERPFLRMKARLARIPSRDLAEEPAIEQPEQASFPLPQDAAKS